MRNAPTSTPYGIMIDSISGAFVFGNAPRNTPDLMPYAVCFED